MSLSLPVLGHRLLVVAARAVIQKLTCGLKLVQSQREQKWDFFSALLTRDRNNESESSHEHEGAARISAGEDRGHGHLLEEHPYGRVVVVGFCFNFARVRELSHTWLAGRSREKRRSSI